MSPTRDRVLEAAKNLIGPRALVSAEVTSTANRPPETARRTAKTRGANDCAPTSPDGPRATPQILDGLGFTPRAQILAHIAQCT